jgi:ribosome maturation factor RimP
VAGQRSFTGTLTDADESSVSLDPGQGEITIPLARIRRSNLVPDFDSHSQEVVR